MKLLMILFSLVIIISLSLVWLAPHPPQAP